MRQAGEIRFDSFRLFPSRRLLLDGDSPVRIGSRALDLLIALINRRGERFCDELDQPAFALADT